MKVLITLITLVLTTGSVSQDTGHAYRTQLTNKAIRVVHPKVTLFTTEELGLQVQGELEPEMVHGKWHYSQTFIGSDANGTAKQLKINYLISSKDQTIHAYRCYIKGDYQSVNEFFSMYWPGAQVQSSGSKVGYYLEDEALFQASKDMKVASIMVTSTSTK